MLLAVSNLGIAFVTGGAAVLGSLVGGLVSGGVTFKTQKAQLEYETEEGERERLTRGRVAARLVYEELISIVVTLEVAVGRLRANGVVEEDALPTDQWKAHRATLADLVEHRGWADLMNGYAQVKIQQDLINSLKGGVLTEAAVEAAGRASDEATDRADAMREMEDTAPRESEQEATGGGEARTESTETATPSEVERIAKLFDRCLANVRIAQEVLFPYNLIGLERFGPPAVLAQMSEAKSPPSAGGQGGESA